MFTINREIPTISVQHRKSRCAGRLCTHLHEKIFNLSKCVSGRGGLSALFRCFTSHVKPELLCEMLFWPWTLKCARIVFCRSKAEKFEIFEEGSIWHSIVKVRQRQELRGYAPVFVSVMWLNAVVREVFESLWFHASSPVHHGYAESLDFFL